MILVIILLLFVLSVIFEKYIDKKYGVLSNISDIATGVKVFSTIILTALLCILIFLRMGFLFEIPEWEEQYNSIVDLRDRVIFETEDDAAKMELYNQITEWNKDLKFYQEYQNNFWVGVFIPDVFDRFDYIDYGWVGEPLK